MQTRLKQAIAQSQGLKTIITNNDQLNRSFRLLTCEFSSDNVKLMPMYILNKHCGKKLIKKGTKYGNTFTDKKQGTNRFEYNICTIRNVISDISKFKTLKKFSLTDPTVNVVFSQLDSGIKSAYKMINKTCDPTLT